MPPATQPHRQTRVLDIRTGDQVLVLTGKDAGKKGTVSKVVVNTQGWKKSTAKFGADWQRKSPFAGAAVVIDGINIAKRHTKPRSSAGRTDRQPTVQQGGIMDIAMPLNISNVMVICPSCSRPTRIRHTEAADGRSVRACAHCAEPLTRVEKKRK